VNASRQSFIVSALICIALGALFVARYRLMPYSVEAPFEGGMPPAAALTRLAVNQPWVALAIGAVMLTWTLMLVVQMTIKFAPAASRNYLPAQIFLILGAGIVISGEALASLTAAWLFTLALRQLIFSFNKERGFGEVFHAGFFLGFIPLIYAPAAVMVPAVAASALLIYRRTGREAIVTLVGLALPLGSAEFIRWAVDAPGNPLWREIWRCVIVHRNVVDTLPRTAAFVVGGVMLLALVAVLWMAGHKKGVRKTPATFMHHTTWTLVFVVASAFVPGTSTTLAALLAVPGALIVPYAFAGRAGGFSTLIYCAILAAVLVLDLLPFFGFPAR
jgi:hypothetical protein